MNRKQSSHMLILKQLSYLEISMGRERVNRKEIHTNGVNKRRREMKIQMAQN